MAEIKDEPPPQPEDPSKPAVWHLVMMDMNARDQIGRERYGTPLQPFNGRRALVDAYQEALDLVVYLRQELYEREQIDRALHEAQQALIRAGVERDRLDAALKEVIDDRIQLRQRVEQLQKGAGK
jgi:hypothetical protein